MQKQFREIAEVGKGIEYRPVPFWSWNDVLDEELLAYQIHEMQKAGMGGYFMHSRTGLLTEYLGEKWMKCVRTCVEEGKRLGMKSWLYDEDGFPSGYAGGLVAGRGGEYTQKTLKCRERRIHGVHAPHSGCLKRFLGHKAGRGLRNLEDVTGEVVLTSSHPGKTVFEFYVENGSQYVDTLNPKVVDAFLESTHEAYARKFAADMSRNGSIPGIFTDEPQYAWHNIPWTDGLPSAFKQRRGYDLLEHLPSLFYEAGRYQKTRHDFYRTATELFVEVFTKRIYEWCEAHGIDLTGHQNEIEDGDALAWQIGSSGAAMPHYEFMQIPGIDHLNCSGRVYRRGGSDRSIREYSIPLAKQVSSVAHQFGGRRVLCEIFANFGQGMTFEDQRWIVNWMFVLGIDLVCPHLLLYSLRGYRKRDCPPTISHHQPWWNYYSLLNDMFARTSFMLTRGHHVADILVLHPISSAWCVYHPEQREAVMELNDQFFRLSEFLLQIQRDYDYGDEIIMRTHASVEHARLKVGSCRYSVVILPPSISLFKETYELLRRFGNEGGSIVAIEPVPYLIEGEKSAGVTEFFQKNAEIIPNEMQAIRKALGKISDPTILIEADSGDAENVFYQERRIENKKIFYLFNTLYERRVTCTISILGDGALHMWDSNSGEISPLRCSRKESRLITEVSLAPAGSQIIVLDDSQEPLKGRHASEMLVETVTAGPPWDLEPHELNVLLLDFCDYRFEGEDWQMNRSVLRELSRPPFGDPPPALNRMLTEEEGSELQLRFRFAISESFSTDAPLFLVMETANEFNIKVNGKTLDSNDEGFWIDPSFRKFSIKGLVRQGDNDLQIATAIHPLTEIENCYIIGDFSVQRFGGGKPIIAGAREVLEGENLSEEGFHFYCGSVTLSKEISLPSLRELAADRIYLELEDLNAAIAEVSLNGVICGLIPLQDRRLDVSEYIQPGSNLISLKIVGSLRNLLGPHHFTGNEAMSAIALLSIPKSEEWTDEYLATPFGLKAVSFKYFRECEV